VKKSALSPEEKFITAALRLGAQWAAVEGLLTLSTEEGRFLEAFKALQATTKGIPYYDLRRLDSRRRR
jgi:hypothetical protein